MFQKESPFNHPRKSGGPGSFRFSPFFALLSVLSGVLVFFLFAAGAENAAGASGSVESCIVLALDESQNDRSLSESLERGGISGIVSESSQNVFLDDFGSLKPVALDSFYNEIESFDPRDDGYAAKLRAFFVRDGKRFFFLPLLDNDAAGFKTAKLKKQIGRVLADTPFTFSVLRQKSFFWQFVFLAAACAGSFSFSRSKRLFVRQIPVLLALGWCGSFGFILAAFLAGISELLREPLEELAASRRYGRKTFDYAGTGFKGLRERLKPFRINTVLALLFVLLFAVFSAAAKLPPLPLAAGCGAFFLICVLNFRDEAARPGKSRHIPFTPVRLLPFRGKTFFLSPLLLPFGAAAVLVLFLSLLFPFFSASLNNDSAIDPRFFVSAEDYGRHIDFQTSFSYSSLDEKPEPGRAGLNTVEYLRYYLGEDGLIAGAEVPRKEKKVNYPPFPLEQLMRFLIDYSNADTVSADYRKGPAPEIAASFLFTLKECIPVIIIVMISALNLLKPGTRNKKKKAPVFGDKRMAA